MLTTPSFPCLLYDGFMQPIRAIPKTYSGVRFRSTLEADWACTLDRLSIRWQYEPGPVKLPSGELYLPDFYLPDVTTWLEVKGPHDERIGKVHELAKAVEHAMGCNVGGTCTCDHRADYLESIGLGWDRQQHFSHCEGRCRCSVRPWRLVMIGRPAISGRLTFESVDGWGGHLAVCPCTETQLVPHFNNDTCRACGRQCVLVNMDLRPFWKAP